MMTGAITIFICIILIVVTGLLFVTSDVRMHNADRNQDLSDSINSLLPQTQCRACGYPGCRPYAVAITTGETDIYRCPPGGDYTISRLAELLGITPETGNTMPDQYSQALVAGIDEQLCIGCVKCINACPVDAIIGAAGQMHTVMPKVCTGCGLCVAPCPVDCITLSAAETRIKRFVWLKPQPAEIRTSA